MQKRGIGGKLGAWIETWLCNRSQFVQVGEERSRIEKCSSGTPQGSQSGPRFFCTVLSDVFQDLTHIGAEIDLKMSCYADDTRILFQCKNQAESLIVQEVVNTMHQKIKAAGLQVNASKSILVYYGRGNYITPLFIDGQEVPVCNQSLELGCIFSKSMSFTPQLERNIQKANNFVFLVRNTLKVRNRESLKTLYQVYYLPILTYGIQVWFNPQAQTKKSLYKAYKNFWRLGNGVITPPEDTLDPYQMALYLSLTFLFQMKIGENNLGFDDYFKIKHANRTRAEAREEIEIKNYKHDYRGNTFTIHMARHFNSLPKEIQDAKTMAGFKTKVKAHLQNTIPTPNYDFRPWKVKYGNTVN